MKNERMNRRAVPALRRLDDDELRSTTGAGKAKAASTGGDAPRPTESCQLSFTELQWTYR